MFVPPGQGNAPHTHEVEEVFFILAGKVLVFIEDGAGNRAETVLGPWDCVSCPANVIHGFTNVGLEPAYLQVMLGKVGPISDLRRHRPAGPARRAPRRKPRPALIGTRSRKEDRRSSPAPPVRDISTCRGCPPGVVRSPTRTPASSGSTPWRRQLPGVLSVLAVRDAPDGPPLR
jgi:hypothetical protein